ncbi:MAG: glycosyltransferase [Tenuifilaceae bacterium]|jgi:glycosyltransferase involved in cell wall biosynthesis|nr:glycosyltransferase [Tenuifilaceae bacterium]
MQKILFIHHKDILENTANNIQVISMCNAFCRTGCEVTLLIPTSSVRIITQDDLEKKIGSKILFNIVCYRQSNFRSVTISTIISLFLFTKKKGNRKLITMFDIVFTRHQIPYLIFRRKAKSICLELHNNHFYKSQTLDYFFRKVVFQKYFLNKTLFIAISKNLKAYWKEHFLNINVLSLHDGFDEVVFKNLITRNDARTDLNLQKNKKIVSYIGSLYLDREVDVIIELAKHFPSACFIVAGGPNENAIYYSKIASENAVNNIHFPGHLPYSLVPKYLFSSDVLLALWSSKVPTIKYCSPLKIFEYMASGRIIVAHAYPTIKEVLTDGVDSLLVNPGDFEDLRKKVKVALNLEDQSLGLCAREKAFSIYTWQERAKQIIDNIKSL